MINRISEGGSKIPPEEELGRIQRIVADIRKDFGFDTVQVFITKLRPDGDTEHMAWGEGNWFARIGQIKEWVEKEDESARSAVSKEDE